jgi:hypothetical protein
MRRAALLLSVVTIAAVTGAGLTPASAGTITTKKSAYWAGYADVSPAGSRNDYFRYVTATFTVPAISSCAGLFSSDVSQYAGLAGYWETVYNPLQAAGVYETCDTSNFQPAYYAVYWNVADNGASDNKLGQPDGPAELFAVSPGDVIFASVYFSGPPPGKTCGGMRCQEYDVWRVTDQSTGQTFKQRLPCNTGDIGQGVASCDTNSAEVISQGEPNDQSGDGGTPPFGAVHFSQIKVTDYKPNGASAMTDSQWTTYRVAEYGTVTFKPDVTPGTLTTTTNPLESAFTNTWHRRN